MIFPPKEIAAIVDKTAQYVSVGGPEFEQRVRVEQQNQAKFQFLDPQNVYYAYYAAKVLEFQGGEKVEKTLPEGLRRVQEAEAQRRRRTEELLQITADSHQGKIDFTTIAPKAPCYSVSHPLINYSDIDVIHLTAQFVARNGKHFLIGLMQRETATPQFEFLKPTHAYFGYFTTMVDVYTKCLAPRQEELDDLHRNTSTLSILDKIRHRHVYSTHQAKLRDFRTQEEDEEKLALKYVDWHSFVIVESIDFNESPEELFNLPKPLDVKRVTMEKHRGKAEMAKILQPILSRPLTESLIYDVEEEFQLFNREIKKMIIPMDEREEPVKTKEVSEESEEPEIVEFEEPEIVEFEEPEIVEFEEPEIVEIPEEPEIVEIPEEPEIVEIPEEPEIVEFEEPEIVEIPEEPEVVEIPEEPEIVEIPEVVEIVVEKVEETKKHTPKKKPIQLIHDSSSEDEIVIKKDYVRQRKTEKDLIKMKRCPVTGDLIPDVGMQQHLKNVLRDTSQSEIAANVIAQQKKYSAFTDEISANVKSFVEQRPDLFGTLEDHVRHSVERSSEAEAREAGYDASTAKALSDQNHQLTTLLLNQKLVQQEMSLKNPLLPVPPQTDPKRRREN